MSSIVFCGKQNITLRAHRNETFKLGRNEKLVGNPGNFLALLEFRSEAGDSLIGRPFHISQEVGNKEVNYTSPRIQNELSKLCGLNISEQILTEVKASPFFSILADEATRSRNKEQMVIVLRYPDSVSLEVCEAFMSFLKCKEGTTGRALSNPITQQLSEWGFDVTKMRGQGYDGAANMAGAVNGCAAIICHTYPKAPYLHCSAHALNL